MLYVTKVVNDEMNLVFVGNGCTEGLELHLFVRDSFTTADTLYDSIKLVFFQLVPFLDLSVFSTIQLLSIVHQAFFVFGSILFLLCVSLINVGFCCFTRISDLLLTVFIRLVTFEYPDSCR